MKTYSVTDIKELESWIARCITCVVSMVDTDGMPYLIPMNFAYKDQVIYLHSGTHGHKIEALEAHPQVCILFTPPESQLVYQSVDVACSYSMRSESVLCRGTVEFVEDDSQKRQLMDVFMSAYSDRKFTYSDPAIRNVKLWKVAVKQMSGRSLGNSLQKRG